MTLLEQAKSVREALDGDKLHSILAAHLDGVYRFSARENCDEIVTLLIKELFRYQAQLILKNQYGSGECSDGGIAERIAIHLHDRYSHRADLYPWNEEPEATKRAWLRDAKATIKQVMEGA